MIHPKQIWDYLSHRFNTASLARALDLRRTLSTLSKDPKQSMENCLRGIKHIAVSLASIRTLVPDFELVQLTLNGLDEDYHNLVTTLSYGTNLFTFDDLRSRLIQYEQRLQFLKSKELFQVRHPALATTVSSSESGKAPQSSNRANGFGGNKNRGRNNNCKGNKHQGGGNHTFNQNHQQYASRSVPIGTGYGNIVFSWFSIQYSSPSRTDRFSAGNNSSKGS